MKIDVEAQMKVVRKKSMVLRETEKQKLKAKNRRIAKVNGTILGFNLLIAIALVFTGGWAGLGIIAVSSLWLGFVWLLEKELNELWFIIRMKDGLSDIEHEVILSTMGNASKKEKPSGSTSTNARTNRKK